MKIVFFVTSILIFMLPLKADPIATVYHVTGVTCGKYLNDISTNERYEDAYSWWIAGFITGANLEKERATTTDAKANDAWIKQFCENNPLEYFLTAAIKLNEQLEKHKVTQ